MTFKPMSDQKQKIIAQWMQGDLQRAYTLARKWTFSDPDDLMAWLMLAETLFRQRKSEQALPALQAAKELDGFHPLFFRLVCLIALDCRAYTAAHGALSLARLNGLPKDIQTSLEGQLRQRGSLSPKGQYLHPENEEPDWRLLLTPPWHPRTDPLTLTWAEHDGRLWIYYTDFVAAALAFARGGGQEVWGDYPQVVEELAPHFGAGITRQKATPELFSPNQGYYLMAAAHLHGYFPVVREDGTMITALPIGNLIFQVTDKGPRCTVSSETGIAFMKICLPHVFSGRIKLDGPDLDLQRALPWLTGIPRT
jgi:hypothetical protein